MGAQGEGGLITQVCDMVYSGGRGWAGVFNPWLSHVLKGCTCVRPPPQAPPCPPYTQQHSSQPTTVRRNAHVGYSVSVAGMS